MFFLITQEEATFECYIFGMMRNCYITTFLLFLLFLVNPLFGQEATQAAPRAEVSLKVTPLSYRFYFDDSEGNLYRLNSILKDRFEYPALGLFITDKRKNGHDVEFFNFYRRAEERTVWPYRRPYLFRTTSFQAGYSYYYTFLKKKALNPILGAGAEFMYQRTNTEIPEHITSTFEMDREVINTYVQITPGLQYRPLKKFYLQFTVPVSWLAYGRHILHIHNPTLTENQRHSSESYRQVAAYVPVRLGLRLSAGYVF